MSRMGRLALRLKGGLFQSKSISRNALQYSHQPFIVTTLYLREHCMRVKIPDWCACAVTLADLQPAKQQTSCLRCEAQAAEPAVSQVANLRLRDSGRAPVSV